MIKRIELLVHAGAPSNQKDDERYRAQAQAYSSFDASVTIPLVGSTASGQDVDPRVATHDYGRQTNVIGTGHASDLFLDDTQLAYTALDSQLLTSSLLRSPDEDSEAQASPEQQSVHALAAKRLDRKRKRNSQSEDAEQPQSPMRLERNAPSERQDAVPTRESAFLGDGSTTSSYLKSPVLQRSNKKIKRSVHPARSSSEPTTDGYERNAAIVTSAQLGQPMRTSGPAHDDFANHSHGSTGGNQTTSELPTSYSLSDITSGSSKARPNISQRSTSDPGPQMGSISPTALRAVPTPRKADQGPKAHLGGAQNHDRPPSSAPEVINVETMPKAKLEDPRNDRNPFPTSVPSVPAPLGVQESGGRAAAPSTPLTNCRQEDNLAAPDKHVAELKRLSVSIRPPQPPSTVEAYRTHVTQSLQFLADNDDVKKSYKPISVSRDIRPLERGYWLIQCPEQFTSWPLHEQIEFWRFVERTVGRGDAGWGVWCTRNDEEAFAGDGQASLGVVKIFCWGEIVRHVFLLLYIGSKSKIKKLGLRWIDAEGKVVVQMRDG